MKRILAALGAILVVFVLAVPAVAAAEPLTTTGRVLISTGGDVTLPAGERADVVIVVNGTATIGGEVNTIIAVDGAALLRGARAETVIAIRSPVTLGEGTVVFADVTKLDSIVTQLGDARIEGRIVDMQAALIGIGAVLGPALILLWIGFGLAMLLAGWLLAAVAARQVRAAEDLISREPLPTFVAGILGLVITPIVAMILVVTVVGAPLGFGILFELWPLVAFLGYLVAGIWIGSWILRRMGDTQSRERPYLPAFIGIAILQVLAIVPILGIIAVVASLFGFGAVVLLGWRTIRSRSIPEPRLAGPAAAPLAG